MSSRDLKDEEKSAGLKETKIAIDGIALITNTANSVKNLTMTKLKVYIQERLLTGKK